MEIVKVDMVGAETPERAFEADANGLRAIAATMGIAVLTAGEPGFGRNYEVIARLFLADESSHHLFAAPAGIDVGGVDEIASGFDIGIEHGA